MKKITNRFNRHGFVVINSLEGEVKFSLVRYKGGGDYFKSTHQFVEDLTMFHEVVGS